MFSDKGETEKLKKSFPHIKIICLPQLRKENQHNATLETEDRLPFRCLFTIKVHSFCTQQALVGQSVG